MFPSLHWRDAERLMTLPHSTRRQWRCVMKKFIAVLALLTAFGVPLAAQTASAAPVSPASSSFGGNGY
jgi:hypothetical protein